MNIRKIIIEEISDFNWVGDVPSSDERGFYVGDRFIDTDDIEPIPYYIKNIVGGKVLLTWFSPTEKSVVDYIDSLTRLESRLKDGFIKFKNITNESIGDENKNLDETYYHLDRLVKRLMFINEDGKVKPDMEWDLTPQVKKEIDLSKTWVKTKEDVIKYLNILSDKLKKIPTSTRKKIIKYVLASFIGIAGVSGLMNKMGDNIKTPTDTEIIRSHIRKPSIRKPSYELKQFIKGEEGINLTAYDIGDGMVTIGYGHAEPIGKTKMVPGKTKITKEKADKLLDGDLQVAVDGLNRILDSWIDQGIKVEITQGMYDAMVSMIYNMGIGNFRLSDFIQMVKRGEYKEAQDSIKKTNVTYPGHKPRREKESKIFGGSYNT